MNEISYLQTDEQTITDLRILSNNSGKGSIYDLYNRTRTRGGELLLRELFRKPLSNGEAIANRSDIIAHFARLNSGFKLDATLLDMVEKYLSFGNAPGDNQLHNAGNLSEKEMAEAILATAKLMQDLRVFLTLPEIEAIAPYQEERLAILELLQRPELQPMFTIKPTTRLSFAAASAYDTLLRTNEQAAVLTLLRYIYHIDVYMSVALVAKERGYCFAKISGDAGSGLTLTGVYYPLLQQPVANDLQMSENKNLLFLTGANMAGKSTILRAISTALYIAHVGFPVAARSMEFVAFDGLYTTINLPDNLGIGASHFYVEVLRVKKMATELAGGNKLFVIFDELFRGTNVKDAEEGTIVISATFSKWKNSLFIISSHIVEAADTLQKEPSVFFGYMPTKMLGHVPEYTYVLASGTSEDRHGMLIIQKEGILDILQEGNKHNTFTGTQKKITL